MPQGVVSTGVADALRWYVIPPDQGIGKFNNFWSVRMLVKQLLIVAVIQAADMRQIPGENLPGGKPV